MRIGIGNRLDGRRIIVGGESVIEVFMRRQEPVNRLMTVAVLSVDVNDPAGEVLRLFSAYPVHHLPVVKGSTVMGMIGTADLLKLEALLPPTVTAPMEYLNQHMKAGVLVRKPAITVQEHDTVEQAAELMTKHGIHALPVVNVQNHLVGILTTTDIINSVLGFTQSHTDVVAERMSAARRLTAGEFADAISAATVSVSEGRDSQGLAEALLYAQQRLSVLETVASMAARYLASGQDIQLHAALTKAIEHARGFALVTDGEQMATLGLGAG